ncbi:predicted protein [Sclerotinia sclerotiorum 1980 UF-70]|uniref:Uncharacterized protein n=1 Tax=Sclerotinia sclerotiorum (strain ATCC 18683 / 1980 / Ss-1) TaxID=665079 RepID=A7EQT0_SCLS1|nr:predicted protein [Sclerotinia sclerotiorum 1980 UF-70]EDN91822.1 predicted protein [Sclerotinia sclerotiorum 1980 UF-70]
MHGVRVPRQSLDDIWCQNVLPLRNVFHRNSAKLS